MKDSPIVELERLMDRDAAIANSTTVSSVSDDWLSQPPSQWHGPAPEQE
jgi:hypothetical protein